MEMMRTGDSPVSIAMPTEHATFETEQHVPPVVRQPKWLSYLRYLSAALIGVWFVLLITLVILVATGKNDSKNGDVRRFAPAPGPGENRGAAPPLFLPLPPLAIIPPPGSLDHAPYESICNTTINRDDCLAMFNGTHEAGDLKQWTVKAMEAAQQAINKSYVLAQAMKKGNQDNLALQQCIDVFADALGDVNRSIFLVKSTKMSSGQADVQTLMSAAMTNCDTCGEGIEDVGSFPGSERITGLQAKHVDTMLSIALTFVNHLSTAPVVHRYQNRRLLHVKAGSGTSFSGRIRAGIRGVVHIVKVLLSLAQLTLALVVACSLYPLNLERITGHHC